MIVASIRVYGHRCHMLRRNSKDTVRTQKEVCGRAYFGAACIIGEKTPGLSRTLHSDFQDFPGPENFTNTIPGAVGMIS